MKNKIIGIFVFTLLFISSIISASSIMGIDTNNKEFLEDYSNLESDTIGKIKTPSDWVELEKLISSDGSAYDEFGTSVSIYGDYAIIGASCDDGCRGSAYIFKRDGSTWSEQAKLVPSDVESADYAGLSVSISGDYAIVGAPLKEAAYVFIRSGTSWSEQAKLTSTGGGVLDFFGWSVAISGEYAIVGGTNYDHGTGIAFVFKRSGTTWNQEGKLLASDGAYDNRFGYVAIDEDVAVIGAYGDDNDNGEDAGAAYVFKREPAGYWYQSNKIIANDGAEDDSFGVDVEIMDDYIVVGALGDDSLKGSTYVFKYIIGVGWNQQAKLTASDGSAGDRFGNSVSIIPNQILVGSFFDDSGTGSAYIFKHDGSTWTEEAKLTASDGTDGDIFGCSVSMDESNVILGARTDENENGIEAGAAYIFKETGAKICCDGSLSWSDVKPNSTVTGEFQISNCGEEGSLLNWQFDSAPTWGVWEVNPDSGIDLAEGSIVTIEVTVIAPPDKNKEFTGKVKMINTENPSDYCEIDVVLNTPKNKPFNFNSPLFSRLFEQFPNIFPIMRYIVGLT